MAIVTKSTIYSLKTLNRHYLFMTRTLQNLIHPVEFPLCGTPFGGFHRAGFCHPNGNGGEFF